MKCLVCGLDFSGDICPRCGFPVIQSTNVDDLMREILPTVEAYRINFFGGSDVSVAAYSRRNDAGKEEKTYVSFGNVSELSEKKTVLPLLFTREPDVKTVTVSLRVGGDEHAREFSVGIPNVEEQAPRRLGIEVDGEYNFRLFLFSKEGEESYSESFNFFEKEDVSVPASAGNGGKDTKSEQSAKGSGRVGPLWDPSLFGSDSPKAAEIPVNSLEIIRNGEGVYIGQVSDGKRSGWGIQYGNDFGVISAGRWENGEAAADGGTDAVFTG